MRFSSPRGLIRTASSFVLSASRDSAGIYSGNTFPLIHTSFAELADRYDAFILDQFGVLHNGVNALDGARECVEYLYKKNKKIIILSNTSAPAEKALSNLPKFGFDPRHFLDAITSGEEASRYVRQIYGNVHNSVPTKAIFLTWDALKPNNPRLTAPPQAFLDKCGNVRVAETVHEASLVLLHGSEVWYRGESLTQESLGSFIENGNMESIDAILKECITYNLPLVCANPDHVVVTPTGGRAYMPGKIAERYSELGGDCKIFGKPHVEHFEACIRKLGLKRDRVAHVGDSLCHDIAGAMQAEIPTVFVTSGIHALDLGTCFGEMPERVALDKLFVECEHGPIYPTHVISTFCL